MRCVSPLRAWKTESGAIVFAERGAIASALMLRCGQCIGCRISRTQDWSLRCVHEARMYDRNCFVTLTYDDDHLQSLSLNYRDFQLFMYKLRDARPNAWFDDKGGAHGPRFFMCGEYGENLGRPHFHACLFGCDFPDMRLFRANVDPSLQLYHSVALDLLWGNGLCVIGEVSQASASYVASYVIKKRNGVGAEDYYWALDERTGELVPLEPEFAHMSLKPGIGARWYAKFGVSDVRPRDAVIRDGRSHSVPAYYDRLVAEEDLEWIKYDRFLKSALYDADNSPIRLEAQAIVAKARLKLKRRSL